tara:strand:+ start:406 stop:555 length:150 start_codon:yes stop_codon:yes gene_type:complete
MVERRDVRVIISMIYGYVQCIVVIEYDRRRSGLPRAPLDIEYDNNSIEY